MSSRILTCFACALLTTSVPASATPSLTRETCDDAVRAAPDDSKSYRCYYLLARRNQADSGRAGLREWMRRGVGREWPRLYLAMIDGEQNRLEAEPLFRAAINGFEAAHDARGAVMARNGLAYFFDRLGRAKEAEAEAAGAERAAEQSRNDLELLARVRNLRAWLYFRRVDNEAALRLLDQVDSWAFPDGPRDLQASSLNTRAALMVFRGDHDRAIGLMRRALALVEADGDLIGVAAMRFALLQAEYVRWNDGVGSREKLAVLAADTLEVARAAGHRLVESRVHLHLAEWLPSGSEAREHAQQAVRMSRGANDGRMITMSLRSLAMNLAVEDPRRPDEAFRIIDEALAMARASGDLSSQALVWEARARMRWATGPREAAIADWLAALNAIEARRDRQNDELARARLFAEYIANYYDFLEKLLDAGDAASAEDRALAFTIAERMRARVLLDELDAARATKEVVTQTPLYARDMQLLDQMAAVRRKLMSARLSPSERSLLQQELNDIEAEAAVARAELSRGDAAYRDLRQPALPTLDAIRTSIPEDEALLILLVPTRDGALGLRLSTSRRAWLWTITRDRDRIYPIAEPAIDRSTLSLFVGLLEGRERNVFPSSHAVYTALLQKPLQDLPPTVKKLTIIPDGILNRLPFAALRIDQSTPLAARYTLGVAPSVTVWARSRQRQTLTAPAALVVADPDLAFASATPASERAAPTWLLSGGTRLPGARTEAMTIARIVGGNSAVLTGSQATEHYIKHADLSSFAVLHLAVHAALDDDHPNRTALLLSPGSSSEDGLLQIPEVVRLKVDGRVVLLSACRSASGRLIEGEGVVGLARAFLQAGARTVVGNMWPLRDDEGEALFEEFYKRLTRGATVGAALSGAQAARFRARAPEAAWAGLVVIGDAGYAPFPAASSAGWPRVATGAIALAIICVIALAIKPLTRRGRM